MRSFTRCLTLSFSSHHHLHPFSRPFTYGFRFVRQRPNSATSPLARRGPMKYEDDFPKPISPSSGGNLEITAIQNQQQYEGERNTAGKPHGKGKVTWGADDISYEGDWVDGYSQGEGTAYWGGGDGGGKYVGTWHRGFPHGRGTSMENGNTYTGEWVNGQPHGNGMIVTAKGARYEGQWVHGERNGEGQSTDAKGTTYKGQWKDGKPHGKGMVVGKRGERYEGQWENGAFHGEGTMWLPDGTVRQGVFNR
eukprot:PhF_6_TR19640/c0_g2_i1/m.28655